MMRRRIEDEAPSPRRESPQSQADKIVVPVDPVSEAAVVAHGFAVPAELDRLLRRLVPEQFQLRDNREAWAALGEVRRRGLAPDHATISAVAGDRIADYLRSVVIDAPEVGNAEFHVRNMLWDGARASAARGPVASFLETLRDPRAEPEKVTHLARQVALAFDGHDDRQHIQQDLARVQMRAVERRLQGFGTYSYGLPGLDRYEEGSRRRMIPGPAPGQITVLTGLTGSGKSTMALTMALGIAFPGYAAGDYAEPGRKVLYGAWEMGDGESLEVMAVISLGWSREALLDPDSHRSHPIWTHEGQRELLERMEVIEQRVKFLKMPFRRQSKERSTNDRNLDTFQGYIAASGAEVVFADLWKKCLRDARPEEEEEALNRQQAMVVEEKVHLVALQQQRSKDVEQRADKKPTREGIKGSSAWVEVADTMIGVHRPALWKRSVEDRTVEAIVLKQRWGKWPMAVEFDWSAEHGSILGGREIDYDRPGEDSAFDETTVKFIGAGKGRDQRFRR